MNPLDYALIGKICGGVIAFIALFVRVPKIELNIYAWALKKIGNALNHDVLNRLDAVENKLEEHIINSELERVKSCRDHILKFNDELFRNEKHSKEHFEEVLEDIDGYEKYCISHPGYPNNKATLAIKNIKHTYSRRVEKQDFLESSERR